MPYSARFGLLVLATLGCTPESRASNPNDFVTGGAASVASVLAADGRPTIVGTAFNQSDDDFAIARFRAGILFQDAFEIGSTSRWSSTSP